MARPVRSSAALREQQGTYRPDRASVDAPAPGEVVVILPRPPEWLRNAWALDEWQRLGPIMVRAGLLTQANLPVFAHYCACHGELATIYEQGDSPAATDIAQYRAMVGEFGLTPASAAKIRAPDPTAATGNKFSANGRRPG